MLRKSDSFLFYLLACLFLFGLTVFDSLRVQGLSTAHLQQRAQMVKELALTDLALFTEARYTRHLSQSDLHSAFQDHPMALEHFPSGSLYLPLQESAR
ncbi:MAG: hypothetical protein GY814_03210 [Gammaproteobacteria bacterium]|nr:hypothetical protein [Gammaproteobacteria bacterium]